MESPKWSCSLQKCQGHKRLRKAVETFPKNEAKESWQLNVVSTWPQAVSCTTCTVGYKYQPTQLEYGWRVKFISSKCMKLIGNALSNIYVWGSGFV